jgi:putative phosphoesterase
MKIVLLSDNHAYTDSAIIKQVEWADEIWHAGDWLNLDLHLEIAKKNKPIVGVYGNVDGTELRKIYKEYECFEREGVKVFMTHIGGKPGKYPERMSKMAQDFNAQIYICGHSHLLKVMFDKQKNWLFLNPGACGLHGFHTVRTALRFQLIKGQITGLEIVEWERKNSIIL